MTRWLAMSARRRRCSSMAWAAASTSPRVCWWKFSVLMARLSAPRNRPVLSWMGAAEQLK